MAISNLNFLSDVLNNFKKTGLLGMANGLTQTWDLTSIFSSSASV